jgi:hypothetical protein
VWRDPEANTYPTPAAWCRRRPTSTLGWPDRGIFIGVALDRAGGVMDDTYLVA